MSAEGIGSTRFKTLQLNLMISSHTRRGRFDLVSPRARWKSIFTLLRKRDFWIRVSFCLAAVTLMWLMTAGWNPPFVYRVGYTPAREICARVPFEFINKTATDDARASARNTALTYYANDTRTLEELREGLNDRLFKLVGAETYDEETKNVWKEFFQEKLPTQTQPDAQPTPPAAQANEMSFTEFREAIKKDENLEKLKYAIDVSLMEFRKTGLLKNLEHGFNEGSTKELMVFPKGNPKDARLVDVTTVRIAEVGDQLLPKLQESLKKEPDFFDQPDLIAHRLFAWIRPRLDGTLKLDPVETGKSKAAAADRVEPKNFVYRKGDKITHPKDAYSTSGIEGGEPLDAMDLEILRSEHAEFLAQRSFTSLIMHTLADLGMYAAVFLLAGSYLNFRQPSLLTNLKEFVLVLGCLTATVIIAYWSSAYRTEIIAVVFFAMMVSIAYRHDVSWLLSGVVSMICAFQLGIGLTGFIVLIAGSASASFLTGEIRNRTRLVYVGAVAAAIVFPTVIGSTILSEQPFTNRLVLDAVWMALCAFLAGLLMTAMLPFIEKLFDVQTDLSLLELGDATHPLLQELVRRAPGTYNHSINVASISEAAAEAIGANGLLCRVAAYFHDIGKMRKPEYFVENQGGKGNKHDLLQPAMSTLVIIAHVKDGVEFARKYRLPRVIIDFIEQHHGTTLVEYFYNEANRKREAAGDEDAPEVDESSFRYPGPKPQTRETCVLMLSDAVESASRTLVDPAPSRIENLVHDIMLKRLHDGQFDECGITLKELNLVEESLVKSITATYHSRVKYPDKVEVKKSQPA
jgi:putative nucleotidyltransferase with HDIG domain